MGVSAYKSGDDLEIGVAVVVVKQVNEFGGIKPVDFTWSIWYSPIKDGLYLNHKQVTLFYWKIIQIKNSFNI